jgi:hypothetical protein
MALHQLNFSNDWREDSRVYFELFYHSPEVTQENHE